MAANDRQYFGFKRTRGDASRVDSNPRGVPALIVPTTDRDLHVADASDAATDWNVSNPTDPTLYVHSATTPATDYVAVSHDATNGYVNVASGNLALQVDGTTVATVASTGITFSSGDLTVPDDALLGIGTGNTARLSWDTTDANANELLLQLPAGGGTDVPVLVIGQSIESVDLGMHNGVVDPRVVLMGVGAVTTGPGIDFRKARGTATSPTVVTAGDDLGTIRAYACVAAGEYVQSAEIRFDAVATQATTRGPGTITFLTATDAAPSVLTQAMLIDKAQLVTVAAGLTATTGNVTISAGSAVLGEATVPAGTICYIGRDNTGDTTINALTGKTINLAINGSDIATLSATVLGFTGTIAATGARVTQSYHTNLTSTNAVTVDSSETVKQGIAKYVGDALAVLRGLDVITYRHENWLDPSGETKLGVRAESVTEPLALQQIERDGGGQYPGVNLYGLLAVLAKAVQQLDAQINKPAKVRAGA